MIKNDNGLLVDTLAGCCVGYLFFHEGRNYSPNGDDLTGISEEDGKRHNLLLSEGEILGLDSCEVGQCGTFFWVGGKVQTWMGTVVSKDVSLKGKSLTFRRNGKTFFGRLKKGADCFNFERTV